jgi:excisionase family DNA binding protein
VSEDNEMEPIEDEVAYLRVGEVARRLEMSAQHVYRLLEIGVLHAVRAAGVNLFREEEVERVARERAARREAGRGA